jgi:hypothetical protein
MFRDLELHSTKHDSKIDIKSYIKIAFRNESSVYLVKFNESSSRTKTMSIEKIEKMMKIMMMIFVRTTQMIILQDISEKNEHF